VHFSGRTLRDEREVSLGLRLRVLGRGRVDHRLAAHVGAWMISRHGPTF
jgi:hypothetical protein